MKNGKLNINISGGNSNIGNISQGDNTSNNVHSQTLNVEAEQAFSDFFNNLEKLSISTHSHEDQILALQNDVLSIKKSLEDKSISFESLPQIAKSLYEKYGWAGDILKKLFQVVVPSIIL